MSPDQPMTDELLLDYLLERCDPQQCEWIREALQADAALAARFARLKDTLDPLGTWTTPPPPETMVSDILSAIASADARKPGLAGAVPGSSSRRISRPIISLREVLALAACIAIFFGILMPSMSAARHHSRMRMCANNLRSVGFGTLAYATASGGFAPYAGPSGGKPWLARPGQPAAPNTRHLILVFKGKYVGDPDAAMCPGRRDLESANGSRVAQASANPGVPRIGYHLQYFVRPIRVDGIVKPSAMPLLSDMNPLFEGGTFHRDIDPATANSLSHRGKGQNVLHLDGSVRRYPSPIRGLTDDNIWQIKGLRYYEGSEVPADSTDAFMTP
ncbi:MAG: type II secretion system protein [Phycisphaerae bacterium]